MLSASTDCEHAEAKRRIRVVSLAVVVSLVVCALELIVGLMFGLESLLAEGVHTLMDGAASLVVLVAVYLAAKPADRGHPFGHGKYEALGAVVEGSSVFVVAIGIAYRSVVRLSHGEVPEQIPILACVLMAVTSVVYWVVSTHLMREARRTKSPAILAEALHLRTHIYITAGVGGGLLIGRLGGWLIADTVLALAVAACLFGVVFHIFREVLRQFTDAALPEEEIKILGGLIDRYAARFVEVHDVRTRQSGSERHINMHLVVMPETTVAEAHALSHEIESAIVGQWPATRTTVHIEPHDTSGGVPVDDGTTGAAGRRDIP